MVTGVKDILGGLLRQVKCYNIINALITIFKAHLKIAFFSSKLLARAKEKFPFMTKRAKELFPL